MYKVQKSFPIFLKLIQYTFNVLLLKKKKNKIKLPDIFNPNLYKINIITKNHIYLNKKQ